MLFHVRMDVCIPRDISESEVNEIKAREKAYSQELQKSGKWVHLWRIVGEYANFSVFDVEDSEELHKILTNLPLFPFMKFEITSMCTHPSSIR